MMLPMKGDGSWSYWDAASKGLNFSILCRDALSCMYGHRGSSGWRVS